MGVSANAVTTLVVSGLFFGTLYALVLIVAFRWLGVRGGIAVAALALIGWGSLYAVDPSGRYHAAVWPVRYGLLILILAVSTVPAIAVYRAQNRLGGSYLRQAAYGIGGFYLAILGSLCVGIVLLLIRQLGGR